MKKANWRAYIESREQKKIEAIYNYVSCNGTYTFTKIRLEGKKLLYGILENERFTYGLPRNTPRKSLKAIYGNVKALNKAVKELKEAGLLVGVNMSDDDILSSNNIRRLSKRVKCIETGETFPSIMAAGRAYNISYQVIASCLHGRGKTAAGKHWKFEENKDEVYNYLKEIAK